jgi:hypothetical protein
MPDNKLPTKLQDWVEARKRHRLSHAHVQMARELGLNPRKLGKLEVLRHLPLPRQLAHAYHPVAAALPIFSPTVMTMRRGLVAFGGGIEARHCGP